MCRQARKALSRLAVNMCVCAGDYVDRQQAGVTRLDDHVTIIQRCVNSSQECWMVLWLLNSLGLDIALCHTFLNSDFI